MSTAFTKAAHLKPEIRLAQAVSEFEANLSSQQKAKFRTQRSQSKTKAPDTSDVMRLTAEVDRQISKRHGGQCFGPRFTYFLQGVQQFAAIGDVVVGGSQNLIACGVWSLVRMSILSIINTSTYVDKLSSLFMEVGRSTPRNEALALLYPRSTKLQSCLSEYFIVVVRLCRYIFQFAQKSALQQFASTLSDAKLQAFRSELNEWASSVQEEIHLHETQENTEFRALSRNIFQTASYQRKLAKNLQVLDFCSTYNFRTTWKQIRKTGNTTFFLQFAEYREWRDCSDSCTLICSGKLGSGKSVMLANIVDDLNLSMEKEYSVVTNFFCRHDVPESLDARTILGSLARQMLSSLPDLVELSEDCDVTRSAGDVEEVLELLIRGFPSTHKAYIVLDGLDECDNAAREALLEVVQKMQKELKILVCLSFREEPGIDMQSIIKRLPANRILSMPDNNPDIDSFIELELERCLNQEKLVISDPTLIVDIQEALLRGSQGMFLWVALQIQSLCSMKTDQAIREALADLPKDLSETFQRILQRSRGADELLQGKTLRLVLAAHRPLTIDELREALSVTPGDATWDSSRVLNDIRSALACCGCLLTFDEEELTVRIVHHSVRQFIINGSNDLSNTHFSYEEAQNTMADIIVTYLGYGTFGTELSRARVLPIIAQSVPWKVVNAAVGNSSTTRHLAIKLLRTRRQPAFDMGRAIAEVRGILKSRPENTFKFFTYAQSHWPDHVQYVSGQKAAICRLTSKLFQSRISELKAVSKVYWTHCHWAAENGNTMVLELLLKYGEIDTNKKDHDRLTPLVRAVVEGRKDIVKLLLSTSTIDVNATDDNRQTPLAHAVRSRHTDTVELLLTTSNIDINAKDFGGKNPLILAMLNGHSEMVELLLGTGKVDVNVKHVDGWTPLIWAAIKGYLDIIKLLLTTSKIDVNARDEYGCTSLTWAARKGYLGIIQLLLSHSKLDINTKNHAGWTPLMFAVELGLRDTVELLLSNSKVDVNAVEDRGYTPLIRAAIRGRENIVELLLKTGKVDVQAKDNNGCTALVYAAQSGKEDIKKLLKLYTHRSRIMLRD